MDNSVRKLTELLEPLIFDLDDKKASLDERKKELENVSRMLAYTKDNLDMVGIYADQDLIYDNLDKINSSKEEYKASCYLLNSENENVKQLPQYEKAHQLISDIIEYFKLYKAELIVETQDMEKMCQTKELDKKYYNILSSANPLVSDVEEFNEFLDGQVLSIEDKKNILIYVLKNNLKAYNQ